jgi:hypothetical protein
LKTPFKKIHVARWEKIHKKKSSGIFLKKNGTGHPTCQGTTYVKIKQIHEMTPTTPG